MKLKPVIIILLVLAVSSYIFYEIKQSKTTQNINFYRASNAFNDQEYNLAQSYFELDLEINPQRPESLYMAAQAFMQGKYQSFNKSINYYRQYLALFPNNPPLTYKLIQQLNNVGMHNELKELALKTDIELYKAAIWEHLDIEKSYFHLNLVQDEFKSLDYYLMATRIFSTLHKFQEVVNSAQEAIELNGLRKNNYYLLSQAYRNLKDFKKSKETLKIFELMNLIDSEKNPEQQLMHLNKLFEFKNELQNNLELNAFYIALLIKNNFISEASKKLQSLEFNKLSLPSKISILSSIQSTESYDLTENIYNNPNALLELDEYLLLCRIEINNTKPNTITNYCENAVKNHPHSAPSLYWYGVLLIKNKNKSKAYTFIERAINHAPWMDSWIIHLANLYLLDGNVKLAKNVLNLSINNSQVIQQFKMSNSLY